MSTFTSCSSDFLLDVETNDYDFTTDATTDEILDILSETVTLDY